jgi:cardiolipin synthase
MPVQWTLTTWVALAGGLFLAVYALAGAAHVVLYKRDPRAAVAWMGFVLLLPLFGPSLYFTFGINRVRRRAGRLRRRRKAVLPYEDRSECDEERLEEVLGPRGGHLAPVARVGRALSGRPLLAGNAVHMLVNGEEAFPAMLEAIDGARRSVALLSYIFENDAEVGEPFIAALKRAKERGCEVRVLVDDVGTPDLSYDSIVAEGIPAEQFLPLRLPGMGRNRYANLRNHRKILVVDGEIGFTGGMNLRASQLVARPAPHVEQDTHFRIRGPVVGELLDAFREDWAFVTGEALIGGAWASRPAPAGTALARGLPGDPAESRELLKSVLVAAIGQARSRIQIVSPYFLPDNALVTALNVAVCRGVKVEILIPERCDHRIVEWAMQAQLWQVLVGGCVVRKSPPPFDHSKLWVVDGSWACFGSANLDPRSLRLNFEFNVEVYDPAVAGVVEAHIDAKAGRSREVTLKEVDSRPLGVRLRDGLARLWTPYL